MSAVDTRPASERPHGADVNLCIRGNEMLIVIKSRLLATLDPSPQAGLGIATDTSRTNSMLDSEK